MRKFIITNLILFSAICAGKAQSYETSVEINKSFQSAVCIDLPYAVKDVEAALEKRFSTSGLKGKSSKGFIEYKGVKFSKFSKETVNIYTKVDKNKSNKSESKVYILVSKQDGQFCSSATCEKLIENVKEFEDSLEPYVEFHVTGVTLEKNTEELKKAEKELRNLHDDSVSLEKDKEKILKKIDENILKIQNKEREIEMKQQIVLEVQLQKSKQEADLPK